MRIIGFLLILHSYITPCFGQQDTVVINQTTFLFQRQAIKNDFNSRDTLLQLCRIENGAPKPILKHYLYRIDGDCNNEFTDIGTVQIQGDSLIFKTHYLQKQNDPIPE